LKRNLTEKLFPLNFCPKRYDTGGKATMFRSVQELDSFLRASGYIADPVTVSTVYLAAALHRPLLLEGVAGAGKTQLAYAVAEAAETYVERLQCYQGIDEAKAIGKFDDLQRLCVELRSKAPDLDWESLANELHGRRFFAAGPLLKALEYEKPCVLLIDELDKVDHAFEAMLLEVLSVWQQHYHVPLPFVRAVVQQESRESAVSHFMPNDLRLR
jgi:MoxR-like ATPase